MAIVLSESSDVAPMDIVATDPPGDEPPRVPLHCTCHGDTQTSFMCSPCKFGHFYTSSWEPILRCMHRMNGTPYVCPIVRGSGDYFSVGCNICSEANLRCRFAKFHVASPSYLQLVSFKRHVEGAKHIHACARKGITVVISQKSASKVSLEGTAPFRGKFAWALCTAFSNSTYKDYSKFVKTEELVNCNQLKLEMQLDLQQQQQQQQQQQEQLEDSPEDQVKSARYSGSRECKQCNCAMASVVDEKDQSILWRSVKMSIKSDDCDGTRITRVKLVTANPVVQVHRTIAAVQRDIPHSIEGVAAATMAAIDQLCTVRIGPLDKNSCTSQQSYICPEMKKHARKILNNAAADGSERCNCLRKIDISSTCSIFGEILVMF